MLPTGLLLFMCFATKYFYLTAFWTKLLALSLVILFTFTVRRRVLTSPDTTAAQCKLVATVSMALWASVVLSGRIIGFP